MCILFENSKMWPMYVDYSEEECKRVLRSLELEAYANIVSAFRAQGNLSKERRKMLQDLCSMLGISMERHRAEIRRAVNDEHLNTIAERLSGPNTSTEWAIEGRRVTPLMPRLAPQTVFTAVADSAANAQAAKNATLPLPGKTGVREIANGIETMASRKRKEFPPDSSVVPHKISAMDSQYFNNFCSFDNSSCIPEPSQTPSTSINSESFSPPDSTSQVSSSFSEQPPAKTTASILTTSTTSASPIKPPPKQIMLKSSSTVTAFSSFDQLNSNLLSSRPTSHSPITTAVHEEQISTASDVTKITESKNSQRSSPSITVKTPSIIPTPASSSSTTTTSSDRLPISSSATSSIGNKFLSQIRSKSAGHARQNLSLGLKLNSQSQISQKGLSPKSSPSIKVKQDSPSNFFTKKLSQTVFSSPSSDSSSQFSLPSVTESTSVTKPSISVTKPSAKNESSIVSSSQTSNKLTTVTKSFPKTSAPSSLTRSLFSPATKTGAKSLPPVIFNVSSTSCTPLQTTMKTTVSVSSDSTKTTPQLLPKSTSVGITPSHLKINASSSQTIQYRNDGGVMRSARIVNLSQPVGSRLPCAISPSAISALGLASSSALRVTLPAGSLNTSSSMRVSAAAKPNVIVVHKAQMWPRTQQGAAVIMGSAASLPKISNDINESASLAQKQEKSRLSGAKLAPRPIAPAITSSPAVSATALKIPETSLLANPFSTKTSQPDSSVSSDNSNPKLQENSENQCKKNLLADVIEASGILESGPDKVSANPKDKSKDLKEDKLPTSSQETEVKSFKKVTLASSGADVASSVSQETSTLKSELIKSSDIEPVQSADTEKNGVNKLNELFKDESRKFPKEPKEVSDSLVSSSQLNESLSSSAESTSSGSVEASKEKSS